MMVAGSAVGGAVGLGLHSVLAPATAHARSRTVASARSAEEFAVHAGNKLASPELVLGALSSGVRGALQKVASQVSSSSDADMHCVVPYNSPSQDFIIVDSNSMTSTPMGFEQKSSPLEAATAAQAFPVVFVAAPVMMAHADCTQATPIQNFAGAAMPMGGVMPLALAMPWHLRQSGPQPSLVPSAFIQQWAQAPLPSSDSEGAVDDSQADARSCSGSSEAAASRASSSVETSAETVDSQHRSRTRRARKKIAGRQPQSNDTQVMCSQSSTAESDASSTRWSFKTDSSASELPAPSPLFWSNLGKGRARWADLDVDEDFPDPLAPSSAKPEPEFSRPKPVAVETGSVWALSNDADGCRAVQASFDGGNAEHRAKLANELKGHVWEACRSPHANYVLQKVIEVCPSPQLQFIVDELAGRVVGACRHRFGCRVVQRLLEQCTQEQSEALVEEVVAAAPGLVRHPFGNFVLQNILEHGQPTQRTGIVDALLGDIVDLARHRVASHVVQCGLAHGGSENRARLIEVLLRDPSEVTSLKRSEFGSFVVREALLGRV
eukprot:CAMPEP_0178418448 /NCGR_PEP_ID=MMETSP0689_2-20121128/25092_1 /TAXON_ID=160604 /ORGANISM="Amphidinium massartii, Strain CS-259" /LENGTH=550 /DNA_ID=CAMNT_0020039839 /DNA_START=86 /DNA_END=1738 /DNA_ORIENTATION=+